MREGKRREGKGREEKRMLLQRSSFKRASVPMLRQVIVFIVYFAASLFGRVLCMFCVRFEEVPAWCEFVLLFMNSNYLPLPFGLQSPGRLFKPNFVLGGGARALPRPPPGFTLGGGGVQPPSEC